MVLLQTISFGGFWNGSTAMYKFWRFLEWFYYNVSGMVLLQCISFEAIAAVASMDATPLNEASIVLENISINEHEY
jgi:hypothetical protein